LVRRINKPTFTSPPDPIIFNHQVWELVRQIPPRRVATYGQIGALIPPPDGMPLKDYDAFRARWVGGAMAACPPDVPGLLPASLLVLASSPPAAAGEMVTPPYCIRAGKRV